MITATLAPKEDIDRIIYDPDLYDRASDDFCPPVDKFEMNYAAHFIGGYVDSKIASLFIVHGKKMHFMVLKGFRKHARDLLDASFEMWPHSVYVEIPSLYKAVINFARKYGFRQVRVDESMHLKNGRLYDLHTLVYEV